MFNRWNETIEKMKLNIRVIKNRNKIKSKTLTLKSS